MVFWDIFQDGKPNYLDRDSDGDTILDSVEGEEDKDGDGIHIFVHECRMNVLSTYVGLFIEG